MQSVDDILSSVISAIEQDDALHHLLPILLEAKRFLARGNEFSKEDVDRVADMIEGLHPRGDVLEKSLLYAERSGPNMFARAVAVEIERRRNRRDQIGVLVETNK
ncbi:MAG: hypothetical protein ACTHKQ_03965 [Mesorhizobium sp.]